eukprot:6042537-Pyramimonas_sp.AAC.1
MACCLLACCGAASCFRNSVMLRWMHWRTGALEALVPCPKCPVLANGQRSTGQLPPQRTTSG